MNESEDLEQILSRIPEGWGRTISCDRGWYRLLVQTNQRIAAIAPDYQVYQVKEKYGTLRYYWDWPALKPDCCKERLQEDPKPVEGAVSGPRVPKDRTTSQQLQMDAWWIREQEHLDSAEHEKNTESLAGEKTRREKLGTVIASIVEAAEETAARTCENCGSVEDVCLRVRHHWYKTLCENCSKTFNYQLAD